MTKRTGQIAVNTQDIFPIIKKWLYSEHDIFVRELVSNANDAITKRATLSRNRNLEIPKGEINVHLDKKQGIISFTDNGLGMTEEEVEKYIAQLAFSGAQEFVDKMKAEGADSKDDIIGKFGLGFYSAFMVADKVVVDTLSMNENAKPVKWTCEGNTDYTFDESTRKDIGTTITLTINEESKEFLEGYKLQETLKRHCDFLPQSITLYDEQRAEQNIKDREENLKKDKKDQTEIPEYTKELINETKPLWKQDPATLKDEDYKNFFKKLYPFEPEPLFWLHLRVDHPFTLEGILFFPKFNPTKPVNDSSIKLYCKQVFVSDNVKNIIPEYLGLLKGVIDSSDIPLNVSRSSLQGDPNLTKISNYITKKVAEALKKLCKNEREKYEQIWEDIHVFAKYGCVSDEKMDEYMRPYVLYKNTDGKLITLSEYKDLITSDYKEKMGDKVLYSQIGKSDNKLRQQLWKEKIPVIETDDYIDPHFMQNAEFKSQGDAKFQFTAFESEIENLLSEDTAEDEGHEKIKDLFTEFLSPADEKQKGMFEVVVKGIKGSTQAAFLKLDEQMRKMQQMTMSMNPGQNVFPVKKTLVINPHNALVQNAQKLYDKGDKDLANKICHHVQDLASFSSGNLEKEEKDNFVHRTQELVQELSKFAL